MRALVKLLSPLACRFECHISDESYKIMHEELGSHLCALPPNATSVYQPLDVRVMAPFKCNLRNLWLYEEQLEGDYDEPRYANHLTSG
ncbi:hypothetical protein B5M09_008574 [Aphanomyces astaci]|uniref:DDE-1 domain-containing protein n=1 Tax=Aphanomyces astaci TaxID=112090 RepID=A0A425DIA1_APHAT|nr:hypothetical protein B5M09_008574 [Aphanomyces astaci]